MEKCRFFLKFRRKLSFLAFLARYHFTYSGKMVRLLYINFAVQKCGKSTKKRDRNALYFFSNYRFFCFPVLLPLMLIMIFLFCSICALIQISIFVIFLCIRQLIGDNDVVEEAFSERTQSSRRDPSEKSEKLVSDE